jgi:hypothetical protein
MWVYILLGFFAGIAVSFTTLFILLACGSPDPSWEQSFARHKTMKARGPIRKGQPVYFNPDGTVSEVGPQMGGYSVEQAALRSEFQWEADGRDA